jgi:hypothetical protein
MRWFLSQGTLRPKIDVMAPIEGAATGIVPLRPSTRELLEARNEQHAASEAVRVWLLGSFPVSVGPRKVGENDWHLRKAASFFKLVALSSGHRMHREVVMDRLWPEL